MKDWTKSGLRRGKVCLWGLTHRSLFRHRIQWLPREHHRAAVRWRWWRWWCCSYPAVPACTSIARLFWVQSTPAAVMSGRVERQGCRTSVDDLKLTTAVCVRIVTLLSDWILTFLCRGRSIFSFLRSLNNNNNNVVCVSGKARSRKVRYFYTPPTTSETK